jgi:hypothetical protein
LSSDNPFAGRMDELRQQAGGDSPQESEQQPRKRRRRQPNSGSYAQVPEALAVAGFKALKCPAALVLYEIVFQTWSQKKSTIVLSNARLAQWGVTRPLKRRALAQLEKAGLIRVTRRGLKSPEITLLPVTLEIQACNAGDTGL